MFPDETGKIKFIGKPQFLRDLLDQQIVAREQIVCLCQQQPGEKMFRRDPGFRRKFPRESFPPFPAEIRKICHR